MTVSVTGSIGPVIYGSQAITVNPPLTGLVHATPTSAAVGAPVNLSLSLAGGTSPFTVFWNLGDGSTGVGSPLVHRYAAVGTFNVTVWVNDSTGVSRTLRLSVVVTPTPASGEGTPGMDSLVYAGVAALAIGGVALAVIAVRRTKAHPQVERGGPEAGEDTFTPAPAETDDPSEET